MGMIETVSDLINELGGPTAIARATGYQRGTVALWKYRARIPRSAWPDLIKTFPHVSLDRLLLIEASCAA